MLGLRLLLCPLPNVAAERQRWAESRNRFAVKPGVALIPVLEPIQLNQIFFSLSSSSRFPFGCDYDRQRQTETEV
jgi:hypothetical protein